MADQLALPGITNESVIPLPKRVGKARIIALDVSQILTPATGFMSDYDYTLNPYVGCQFGCAYCYAAFFAGSAERREGWGSWVDVKVSALRQLHGKRSLQGKKVYMSSVTDPYQPVEARIGLTRSLLEAMLLPGRQPRLVIQTRSPLVVRDIDLLKRFEHLRVNVTVTTDSEAIRKKFEPGCPSSDRRLDAVLKLKEAGIKTCICVTPMLPLEDPGAFGAKLAAIGAEMAVAQPFKPSRGPFAASTRSMAVEMAKKYGWDERRYREAFRVLKKHLPGLYEGREGFRPE